MKADERFTGLDLQFWAHVRLITGTLGESKRGSGRVDAYSWDDMAVALKKLGRSPDALGSAEAPSKLATLLQAYFAYRATVLNDEVRVNLMGVDQAARLYGEILEEVGAHSHLEFFADGKKVYEEYLVDDAVVRIPMNKQTGEKRTPAYLTGIVNLLVTKHLGMEWDSDPQTLPVIDHDGQLAAVMSRRMDGSVPSTVNPVAMWEIKEYYYTTTFGSKISDAVYITALDGFERSEIEARTGVSVEHLVMIDAYDTWWGKGRPYLCRLIDLLSMGRVDEIIFGREVTTRLPELALGWRRKLAL